MKVYTNLIELENTLPNGFHDAFLETLTLNYAANNAELVLNLWVGDLHATTEEEREAYKRAKLYLTGLVYFVIDPPYHDPEYKYEEGEGLWLGAGDAREISDREDLKPKADLPDDAFAYWFYVHEWNSHFHVAAKGASLEWL